MNKINLPPHDIYDVPYDKEIRIMGCIKILPNGMKTQVFRTFQYDMSKNEWIIIEYNC